MTTLYEQLPDGRLLIPDYVLVERPELREFMVQTQPWVRDGLRQCFIQEAPVSQLVSANHV